MRCVPLLITSPDGACRISVLCAERIGERMRGLLGRETLLREHALWIRPCSAVHTFGMAMAIDLVFLDRRVRILRIDEGLRPGCLRWRPGACGVLELAAGAARRLGFCHPQVQLAWL